MKISRKLAVITVIGLFLLVAPFVVLATGDKECCQQSIYVGPDQIIDGNFIKAGNIIDIAGAVNGDVIVAGNMITISGPVAGDIIAVGNSIRIEGSVGGSVRVVGSTIQIDSAVERNVWAAGGSVSLGNNSSVGWDVYTGAGSAEIKGPVGGNIWAGTGSLVIGNEVGKDVMASVDAEGQVVLYPEAKIGGNLTFQAAADKQLTIKEGAEIVGETTRKPFVIKKPKKADLAGFFSGAYILMKIISFFSLLVIGLILVTLMPKKILEMEERMVKKFWPSVGWGLVYCLVVPVVVILLMITIIGIPLALIIIPLFLVAIYISKVLVGFTVGLFLINQLSKGKYTGSLIWPLVLGLIVFVVIASIPIFGWIIKLLAIFWALGAAMAIKKETMKEWR